ncbi:MAG: hypothetical protein ACRC51_04155 [Cetobacterium sp.]
MVDILTVKLGLLLFPGMLGLILFQFSIYHKKDLKFFEFMAYSIVITIFSFLFNFEQFILFLQTTNKLDINFKIYIITVFIALFTSWFLAMIMNNGKIYSFLHLKHTGKNPTIENFFMYDELHEKNRRHYTMVKTKDFAYIGNICENNRLNNDYVEFLISDVSIYTYSPTGELIDFSERVSVYLCLKFGEFSVETPLEE